MNYDNLESKVVLLLQAKEICVLNETFISIRLLSVLSPY